MTKNKNNRQKHTPFAADPSSFLANAAHFLPDPQVERLLSLFGGNLHHWIYAENSYRRDRAKKPDYTTEKRHPIEPRVLAALFADPTVLVGLRFGTSTRWGGFDIDAGSILNPHAPATSLGNDDATRRQCAQANLDRLVESAERHGLIAPTTQQSSHKGGIWIEWAFPASLRSIELAALLRKVALEAGFKLKSGQLEAFPNVKKFVATANRRQYSQFRAFRLPMQPETGSYVLNDDLEPIASDLDTFLNHLEFTARKIDMAEVQRQCALAYEELKACNGWKWNASNQRQKWITDLERIIKLGFTGYSQTNDLLGKIATLGRVRDGLKGDELVSFILTMAIALPGYEIWCRHQHEIQQRAREWAKSAETYYWHVDDDDKTQYGTYREMYERAGMGTHEDKAAAYHRQRSEDTVSQIRATLEALKGRQDIPTLSALFAAACEKARELFGKAFSKRTWQKYKERFAALIGTLIRPISQAPVLAAAPPEPTPPLPTPEGQKIAETQAESGSTPCCEKIEKIELEEIAETQAESGSTPCSLYMKVFEGGAAPDIKPAVLALMSQSSPVRVLGQVASGLVQFYDRSRSSPPKLVRNVQSIPQHAVVEIMPDFHSSWWSEHPQQVLVYVKPLGSSWLWGVAVPLSSLLPLLE